MPVQDSDSGYRALQGGIFDRLICHPGPRSSPG
jgi:hypothetical protein